ncbi:hypothetical protein [Actinoplanes sp. NPDC049802]|uniref:hypothetical protein n=1 Tax=Actinoplanes sp. NPDC049802 TaxID=3154742 RepID=UPI0033C7411B
MSPRKSRVVVAAEAGDPVAALAVACLAYLDTTDDVERARLGGEVQRLIPQANVVLRKLRQRTVIRLRDEQRQTWAAIGEALGGLSHQRVQALYHGSIPGLASTTRRSPDDPPGPLMPEPGQRSEPRARTGTQQGRARRNSPRHVTQFEAE